MFVCCCTLADAAATFGTIRVELLICSIEPSVPISLLGR